jgi:hypothetical protein
LAPTELVVVIIAPYTPPGVSFTPFRIIVCTDMAKNDEETFWSKERGISMTMTPRWRLLMYFVSYLYMTSHE